jgi:hypothetical protein
MTLEYPDEWPAPQPDPRLPTRGPRRDSEQTFHGAIQDAIARIVAIRESLAYGDTDEAELMLHDLEADLAAEVARAVGSQRRLP